MEHSKEQEVLNRLLGSFQQLQSACNSLRQQCTSLMHVERAAIHYVEELGICPNADDVYCDVVDCAYCKLCRVVDESCKEDL